MNDQEASNLVRLVAKYYDEYGNDSVAPSRMTVAELVEDLVTPMGDGPGTSQARRDLVALLQRG